MKHLSAYIRERLTKLASMQCHLLAIEDLMAESPVEGARCAVIVGRELDRLSLRTPFEADPLPDAQQ